MNNEPKKHHFIPQFILRNFSFGNNNQLHYYNKKSKLETVENTKDIFMVKNLYRDEKNFPSNPTKIEKDFAIFEREAAEIINAKLLEQDEIILSFQENALIMLFFALMGFRSKNNAETFGTRTKNDSMKFYSKYQTNKDFDDLFKRNLGYLVNCRSLTEVMQHENIDDPFKLFMQRDIFGYFGQYIAIAQRQPESAEFIITDTYPTVITGDIGNGIPLHIYSAFSVSPNRALLMVSNGADATPQKILSFRSSILTPPKISNENQSITIRVKKMHSEEVEALNEILFKEAHEGIAYKTKNIFHIL